MFTYNDYHGPLQLLLKLTIEFSEIQKFSRLAEQAGESNNKYTVLYDRIK